jgi:Cu/Ag efflux protein CusF
MPGHRAVGMVVVAGVALAGCARRVPAPPPPTAAVTLKQGGGKLSAGAVVTATAVVESIDQKSRMVTLKRSDGERVRFRVSDEVKNLAQVKRGDEVTVTYYESVALRLRKPGDTTPGTTVAEAAERARPDDLPAGAVAEVVTVTAKIVGIDRDKREATLELAKGKRLTIKVDDLRLLDRVKVGDTVEATYREAIAVAVERPTTL